MPRSLSARAVRVAVAALVVVLAFAYAPWASAHHDNSGSSGNGKAPVTVMTRNLYLGADLNPAIQAQTLPEFLAATAEIWSHVQQVAFPERAHSIAHEIKRLRPDLIGLQEVALWRTGPLGDPAPATTVAYDYLDLLLAELKDHELEYDVVVAQPEADLEAPTGAPYFQDTRLTMRDVILVRANAHLRLSNIDSGHFVNNLQIPVTGTGTTFVSTRGWTSVDVQAKGQRFRFVNSHLEAFHPGIRLLQAQELLTGPLAADGTVVLVGDMNSGPELPVPENRLAYFALVAGGMVDIWPILHPGDPGFTAGLGDDLNEPKDSLEHRIDMVMVRGAVKPVWAKLFGNEPHNRTDGGLWPSDHLGHAAHLRIG